MEDPEQPLPGMRGMKVLYTLEPGESYKFWDGRIIVVHPDRPPKIVHADGTTEIITAVAPVLRS